LERIEKGAATAPKQIDPGPLNLAIQRQKRGLSLEDVAELTKISMFFLRAIEAGEYAKLPGGIYTTSYLRQYAGVIGIDPATLLAAVAPPPELLPGPVSQPPRRILDRWLRLPALQRP
jgi:transcriptional regulator with XRE-family HTH domain